jgi:RNA binding exosome subunit
MFIVISELKMGHKHKNMVVLEMSFSVHATEDENKLLGILKNNFGIEESAFSKTVFEGYHGNPISRYNATITDDLAQNIFNIIFQKLSSNDKKKLLEDISQNIDSTKALYVRLDKSSLFEDHFRINESNTFHFKFKPRVKYLKEASDFYKKLILDSDDAKGNL